MRLRIFTRGHVRPSVSPYVPFDFWMTNLAYFDDKKSSNEIRIKYTMSDDEVVVYDVPPRNLFDYFPVLFWNHFSAWILHSCHLYRCCTHRFTLLQNPCGACPGSHCTGVWKQSVWSWCTTFSVHHSFLFVDVTNTINKHKKKFDANARI